MAYASVAPTHYGWVESHMDTVRAQLHPSQPFSAPPAANQHIPLSRTPPTMILDANRCLMVAWNRCVAAPPISRHFQTLLAISVNPMGEQ